MNGLGFHFLESQFVINLRYADQLSTSLDVFRSFSNYAATNVPENFGRDFQFLNIFKLQNSLFLLL